METFILMNKDHDFRPKLLSFVIELLFLSLRHEKSLVPRCALLTLLHSFRTSLSLLFQHFISSVCCICAFNSTVSASNSFFLNQIPEHRNAKLNSKWRHQRGSEILLLNCMVFMIIIFGCSTWSLSLGTYYLCSRKVRWLTYRLHEKIIIYQKYMMIVWSSYI